MLNQMHREQDELLHVLGDEALREVLHHVTQQQAACTHLGLWVVLGRHGFEPMGRPGYMEICIDGASFAPDERGVWWCYSETTGRRYRNDKICSALMHAWMTRDGRL